MDGNGNRDVVVIGASAGGVEPLKAIVSTLDSDIPASIFIVLHLASDQPSALAEILGKNSVLPVLTAEEGAPIERGVVYVAPPDHHLSLEPARMRVLNGAKENRFRPSVDVLFRTAARHYGPRTVGVDAFPDEVW